MPNPDFKTADRPCGRDTEAALIAAAEKVAREENGHVVSCGPDYAVVITNVTTESGVALPTQASRKITVWAR